MQLLDDIINELVDSSNSLTSALLKTKVLASRLKNQSLNNWIDKELGGYLINEELPSYRISPAYAKMGYTNWGHAVADQPVPIAGLPNWVVAMLTKAKFIQSIATLEDMASVKKTGTIENPVTAEVVQIVQNNIINNFEDGNDIQIFSLKKLVPVNALIEVLSTVRKKLLDFILKLEEEFGEEVDIVSLREKNQQITTIMHNYITNTGNANVINTGHNASIQASINVSQGNLDDLIRELRNKGVVEQDTNELAELIVNEPANQETQQFGPRVNGWIQKMVGKALEGSWQITAGAAGGLLVELIKAYYGMGN